VFFLAAAIYAFGAIVFILFAKGTVLPWADKSNAGADSAIETAKENAIVKKEDSEQNDNVTTENGRISASADDFASVNNDKVTFPSSKIVRWLRVGKNYGREAQDVIKLPPWKRIQRVGVNASASATS
jgi:hypothetical protein